MPESSRTALRLSWVLLGVIVVMLFFRATTPDLDNLPAYTCNPGHHHTTKECD